MTRVALPAYDITIAPGAIDSVGEVARRVAPAHRYALISDSNVAPRYSARVLASLSPSVAAAFVVPAGESHKTRQQWATLTDDLLSAGYGRDTTILALGGGVVGDLAGFVAATFMRGIPFIQVPTTLLAMIDASIGGKTGVDTPAGKNLVGAFHQPAAVLIDPDALTTLPPAHLRAGMAEAIKHGVIADAEYFEQLGANVATVVADPRGAATEALIVRSVEIKADVVRRDEREGGLRKTLNFGHTIGHAVEAASGYRLLHGEAIAIGMVLETELAERLGVAERGTTERVRRAVGRAGLPDALPANLATAGAVDEMITLMRTDKKARAGTAEYALPARIGAMAGAEAGWVTRVEEALVRAVLSR